MPKLAEFARVNADLGERFLIVGVHQPGTASIDEVRKQSLARQARFEGLVNPGLLPVLVLDADSGGMFHRYEPKTLGDMVLLDPRGTVISVGKEAFDQLEHDVGVLRQSVSALVDRLDRTKVASEASAALSDLLDVGVTMSDAAVDRFVASCPASVAPAVFETMARHGRSDVVLGAIRDKDAKRRRAAFDAMIAAPSQVWARPLLDFTAEKGVGRDDVCLALRAACAAAPALPAIEARVTELSSKGEQPVRAYCLDLLGTLGTPTAKQRLLVVLAGETWRGARLAAALALARIGGDDVVKALERAATEDKIDTVRAAARQALDSIAKKDAAKKDPVKVDPPKKGG